MKVPPASTKVSSWLAEAASSASWPNVIVPRHNEDTTQPLSPSRRYSIGADSVVGNLHRSPTPPEASARRQQVQCDVEPWRRVGQPAEGEEVHTGGGHRGGTVRGDPAGGLGDRAPVDQADGFGECVIVEVVE